VQIQNPGIETGSLNVNIRVISLLSLSHLKMEAVSVSKMVWVFNLGGCKMPKILNHITPAVTSLFDTHE
jgi:hypothetical protein